MYCTCKHLTATHTMIQFHSGVSNCQFVKTDLKLFSYGHTVRIISCSTHVHTQPYPLNLILLPLSEGLGSLLGLVSPLWVSPPPVVSSSPSRTEDYALA